MNVPCMVCLLFFPNEIAYEHHISTQRHRETLFINSNLGIPSSPGERPVPCHICGLFLHSRAAYDIHKSSEGHRDVIASLDANTNNLAPRNEESAICGICGITLRNLTTYEVHASSVSHRENLSQLMHTGRPHAQSSATISPEEMRKITEIHSELINIRETVSPSLDRFLAILPSTSGPGPARNGDVVGSVEGDWKKERMRLDGLLEGSLLRLDGISLEEGWLEAKKDRKAVVTEVNGMLEKLEAAKRCRERALPVGETMTRSRSSGCSATESLKELDAITRIRYDLDGVRGTLKPSLAAFLMRLFSEYEFMAPNNGDISGRVKADLDKDYKLLEEHFTQTLLRLDGMNLEGEWQDARKERKAAVTEVDGLVAKLEQAQQTMRTSESYAEEHRRRRRSSALSATEELKKKSAVAHIQSELANVRSAVKPSLSAFMTKAFSRDQSTHARTEDSARSIKADLDKDYDILDGILSQTIQRLDGMSLATWQDAKTERRIAVKEVHGLLDVLEMTWSKNE